MQFWEVVKIDDRNYIVLKCCICGKHTIIPIDEWNNKKGYATCWNNGKHKKLKVIGANDDCNKAVIDNCMKNFEVDSRKLK